MTTLDDFEAPNVYPTEITVKDKKRVYQICEIAEADANQTFKTTDKNGNRDPALFATFNQRVIAKCVRREDGSPITLDDVRGMRQPLVMALVKAVLEIHGIGQPAEEAVDDAEKN